MIFKIILIVVLIYNVTSKDSNLSEFKIWQCERAITLFRRKPPSINFKEVLNIGVPKDLEYKEIWTPYGHHWWVWDEKEKAIIPIYYGPPSKPKQEKDGILYSGWLSIKETCSSIIEFFKTVFSPLADLKFQRGVFKK